MTKDIPDDVGSYIAGFFDGDGCVISSGGSISVSQATPFAENGEAIVPPIFGFLTRYLGHTNFSYMKGSWQSSNQEGKDWIRDHQVPMDSESEERRLGERDHVAARWSGRSAIIGLRLIKKYGVLKYQQACDSLNFMNSDDSDERIALQKSMKSTKGDKLQNVKIHEDRMNIAWFAGFFDAEGHVALYFFNEKVKDKIFQRMDYRMVMTQKNVPLLRLIEQKFMPGSLIKQQIHLIYYRRHAQMLKICEELLQTNLLQHKQAQVYMMWNCLKTMHYDANGLPSDGEHQFLRNMEYEYRRLKHDRCKDANEARERITKGDFDNFFKMGPLPLNCCDFHTPVTSLRTYNPKDSSTHPLTIDGAYSRWQLFSLIPSRYRRFTLEHSLYRRECFHCGATFTKERGRDYLKSHYGGQKGNLDVAILIHALESLFTKYAFVPRQWSTSKKNASKLDIKPSSILWLPGFLLRPKILANVLLRLNSKMRPRP